VLKEIAELRMQDETVAQGRLDAAQLRDANGGRKSSDGVRSGRGEETVKIAKNHNDAIETAAMAVAADDSRYELRLYVAGQDAQVAHRFRQL